MIIRRQENGGAAQRKALDRWDILHTPDFNANSKEYILYREGLEKENLAVYLVSLCKSFYEQRSSREPAPLRPLSETGTPSRSGSTLLYQCRHCLTLYDEQFGDPEAGQPAGKTFQQLPEDYACPVCGSEKEAFKPVEKTALTKG